MSAQKISTDEEHPKPAARRAVGRPAQVSFQAIFEAARTIGLEKLTLLAVAEALGVTTPALYRYVSSREDLIEKVAIHALGNFPMPVHEGEPWREWAKRYAHTLLGEYSALPGLADFSLRKTSAGAKVLDRHETSIKIARKAGYSEASAFYATRAIIEFVAAWVSREERRKQVAIDTGIHPDQEFVNNVLGAQDQPYPQLTRALQIVARRGPIDRFDFTLRALIAGLEDEKTLS